MGRRERTTHTRARIDTDTNTHTHTHTSTQRTVKNVDENLSPCFRQPPTFRISTLLWQHNSRKYIYLKSLSIYLYLCLFIKHS